LRRDETLEQLKARGYDLVYISSHETECALCKQFQGKVFSISGNNSKFPPFSNAIDGGLFHTGCMHVISLASEEKDRFVGSLQDKEGEEARQAEIDRQATKHNI
jgi:hypothetical protein